VRCPAGSIGRDCSRPVIGKCIRLGEELRTPRALKLRCLAARDHSVNYTVVGQRRFALDKATYPKVVVERPRMS
jgi:hypothetical protein